MSDLRPQGIEVEIGGQQRNFLFTLNVIDEVQEKCNMPLVDTMKSVVDVIDNNATNHEAITVFKVVVAALLNGDGSEEKLEAEEVGNLIHLGNYKAVAWKVLEAYGVSIPDPDEEDEEEEEEENPNPETGQ